MVLTAEDIVGPIRERRLLMDNPQSFPLVKAFCDPPGSFAFCGSKNSFIVHDLYGLLGLRQFKRVMHLYKRAPSSTTRRSTSIIIVILKWNNSKVRNGLVPDKINEP